MGTRKKRVSARGRRKRRRLLVLLGSLLMLFLVGIGFQIRHRLIHFDGPVLSIQVRQMSDDRYIALTHGRAYEKLLKEATRLSGTATQEPTVGEDVLFLTYYTAKDKVEVVMMGDALSVNGRWVSVSHRTISRFRNLAEEALANGT